MTDVKPLGLPPSVSAPNETLLPVNDEVNNNDHTRHHRRRSSPDDRVENLNIQPPLRTYTDRFDGRIPPPEFDWNSEADMTPDLEESVVEEGSNAPPEHDQRSVASDAAPEEPWNAVCVVGLRVYSMLKGNDVVLKVIRPPDGTEDVEKATVRVEEKVDDGAEGKLKLDPDDMAKGAVAS